MIFIDLDKWMFEIEQENCPTAKQRRQYAKIEHIRDKTFEKYIKQFQIDKQRGRLMKNECPRPKYCRERIVRKKSHSEGRKRGYKEVKAVVEIEGVKVKKPPLGVKSQWLHVEERVEAERTAENTTFRESETDTVKQEIIVDHDLKIHPEQFDAVMIGVKTFEYRLNDRNFKNGDVIRLLEYLPLERAYTGLFIHVKVTYLLEGGYFGIPEGYVIMSIKRL